MGIFDSLTFNPQGYGGQGGGLLDMLKSAMAGYQQSPMQPQNFDAQPIAVGNYMMPRHGPASLYEPQKAEAALPPNAQPTQGQLPQASPGFGDRLLAGLQGFAEGGAPIPAIAGAITGLATGEARPGANMTQQALVRHGFDPAIAQQIARNPGLLSSVLPHLAGTAGQTDDIKEYNFAKKEDPSLTFEKFMARKKSVTGEYGMQPVYGTDDKGNTVVLQLGKSGDAKQSVLPPGVKLSAGIEKIDLGTHWGIIDKKTGNMVGQQAKDLVGKESAEERGKIQGQAQGELPSAELAAKRSVSKIQEFLDDKGFNEVFGALDQFRPNFTMSDDGRRALTRFNQMEGTAFLEGRSMLKGGGAITDFESKKAEAAFSRLSRSLSEDDARAALKDFKEAVEAGLEKLRAKARGGAAATPSAPAAADPLGLR